jgi:excisionase family DNA binding protein
MKETGLANPSVSAASAERSLSPLWSVKQLASFLGVKPGTVYKMVERGELPVVRLGLRGRTLRFRREQVEVWLVARGANGSSLA